MITALKRIFSRKKYTYGRIINDDGSVRHKARINHKTGDVEFLLWKKGEHGHDVDFWHRMGNGWINKFKAD